MGIDYGMGMANIDAKTGIRYGVVPEQFLPEWLWDHAESVYDNEIEVACPCCERSVVITRGQDLLCPHCEADLDRVIETALEYQEPSGFRVEQDGFVMGRGTDDSDWWCTESEYIIKGSFCSPCAPGAVYVNGAGEDAWAYCPPPEWLENLKGDNKPINRLENPAALED